MPKLMTAILHLSSGKCMPEIHSQLNLIIDVLQVVMYLFRFFRNVSQNATREHHRSSYAGIAGCATPGGDFFVPNKGRSLLGCEKLLIQGIPYFRLALGNETEVELGDLAGNAMSLTVISACMLAAITCQQFRVEVGRYFNVIGNKYDKKTLEPFFKSVMPLLNKKAVLDKKSSTLVNHESLRAQESARHDSLSALNMFIDLAKIAQDAISVSSFLFLFGMNC